MQPIPCKPKSGLRYGWPLNFYRFPATYRNKQLLEAPRAVPCMAVYTSAKPQKQFHNAVGGDSGVLVLQAIQHVWERSVLVTIWSDM